MRTSNNHGFSLIELIIVVAIIGILAAFAYPSYQQHVLDSRRAEAKASLMELAQFMERFYTENNRFDRDLNGAAPVLPFDQSPRNGTAFYTIQFNVAPTATTFRLDAIPEPAQADDDCGTISLNEAGQKMVSGSTVNDCWNS